MVKRKPNVLFLMSDQHRADISGFQGNSTIRTPILDKLAQSGIVFNNAYAPSPICIPSRQCMAAGQLPMTCDCKVFGDDLAPGYMTFARRLSQFGYETVASGKLHHVGPDQMQGWTSRIGDGMHIRHDYIEGRNLEAFRDITLPTEYKWSQVKEIKRAGIGQGPSTNAADAYNLKGALRFVENFFTDPFYDRATPTRPLLLMMSFVRPHVPFLTTHEKFTYYLNRVTPYLNEKSFDHPFLGKGKVIPGVDVSDHEIKRATAAYYGMVEEIDDDFGILLEALKHVGQDIDDWIIIYTSDHGESLGEHTLWEKSKFFEGSVKVPLIIRLPGGAIEGSVVEENVNLCDLFATICDLTEVPCVEGLDSRSLIPLINGDKSTWNNESISHFGGLDFGHEDHDEMQSNYFKKCDNLMIKHDQLKYQFYGEEMSEVLFDLSINPEETDNFINDSRYKKNLVKFRKRRDELGYGPNGNLKYKNAGY